MFFNMSVWVCLGLQIGLFGLLAEIVVRKRYRDQRDGWLEYARTAFSISPAICSGVRPAFARKYACDPTTGAKASGAEKKRCRHRMPRSARDSATALPRPPMRLCSSTVTMSPVAAARTMASVSIGLTVCMLRRPAFMPSDPNFSAATRAVSSIAPVAMSVTSVPARIWMALPITKENGSLWSAGSPALPRRK